MFCQECGYKMDALDEACPRCVPAALPGATTTKNGSVSDPDKIDKVLTKTSDFFKYPSGKPKPAPAYNPAATNAASTNTIPTATIAVTHAVPHAVDVGDAWYYVQDGKRLGPIARDQLPGLIENGVIRRTTMVWQKGMQDWQQASLTNLSQLFAVVDTGPPPLDLDQINNTLVWFLAFVPLISALLLNFLSSAMRWDGDTATLMTWVLPLGLNVCLCILDEQQLKAAGHDTKGIGGMACFLVPVYLFMRAAKLGHSNSYAWVWLACFGVSLFIPIRYMVG